jgi:hypothetical protein
MEAAAAIGLDPSPDEIRLNTFGGRPVYRFTNDARMVYADTGAEQIEVSDAMRDRIAAAWTGQPASAARVENVEEVDQWTLQIPRRSLQPLYKYSWPNGEQLYISGATGEVAQYTTFGSRVAAHVSAIPHWVYYTPLRKRQPTWLRFMIWTSGVGAIGALLGVIIGAWMYSPSRKYRLAGKPTGIPYRGQKRWHMVFGLVFGVATVTWGFSGMMSLDPFPSLQAQDDERRLSVDAALLGRVQMDDFRRTHPRDLLARVPDLEVKELEFTSFAGTPVFAANLSGGKTQMISLEGKPIPEFDRDRIVAIVKSAAAPAAVETRVIDQYDLYYLDRTRQRPLPVILATINDAEETRYYIDPKTARVVGGYTNRNWVARWLYNGLHSLDFPWLYNYRPLWDIVVITFMLGGSALCVTSLVLAWRVVGRKLRRASNVPNDTLTAEG